MFSTNPSRKCLVIKEEKKKKFFSRRMECLWTARCQRVKNGHTPSQRPSMFAGKDLEFKLVATLPSGMFLAPQVGERQRMDSLVLPNVFPATDVVKKGITQTPVAPSLRSGSLLVFRLRSAFCRLQFIWGRHTDLSAPEVVAQDGTSNHRCSSLLNSGATTAIWLQRLHHETP